MPPVEKQDAEKHTFALLARLPEAKESSEEENQIEQQHSQDGKRNHRLR
jgi:hypothetical protein